VIGSESSVLRKELQTSCTAADQKMILIGRTLHDEAFGTSLLFSRDGIPH
jgi:hypothetical protein